MDSLILCNTVLIGRNGDLDDLMNILLILIVAVFWAIGGILKARADKTKRSKGNQQQAPPRRPAPARRRQPSPSNRLQQLRREHRPSRPMPSGPAEKNLQPRPQTQPDLGTTKDILHPSVSGTPEITSDIKEMPSFTSGLGGDSIGEPPQIFDEQPHITSGIRDMLSLEDPKELRKAILHYEIIGKPKALSDPPA